MSDQNGNSSEYWISNNIRPFPEAAAGLSNFDEKLDLGSCKPVNSSTNIIDVDDWRR